MSRRRMESSQGVAAAVRVLALVLLGCAVSPAGGKAARLEPGSWGGEGVALTLRRCL